MGRETFDQDRSQNLSETDRARKIAELATAIYSALRECSPHAMVDGPPVGVHDGENLPCERTIIDGTFDLVAVATQVMMRLGAGSR
jgi:hypothetical protein